MTTICVLTESERVWSLGAWERTLPVLRARGFDVCGLWECPAILGTHRGLGVPTWYLRTFGLWDFTKLVAFATIAGVRRRLLAAVGLRAADFEHLATRAGATYGRCTGPNDPRFVAWIKARNVDLLLITVSFVLGREVIDTPRLGAINKHAAVLPSNRGLFPYFWAQLHGQPQGVSYHEVDAGIDEGRLLFQATNFSSTELSSMVAFYCEIFRRFPDDMTTAIESRLAQRFVSARAGAEPSYFGLPTARDVKRFRSLGARIVRLTDLTRACRL